MRLLKVKEVAQSKGVTITQLERLSSINMKTLQAIWHNPRHAASFKTLERIAEVLNVRVTDLIEDIPETDLPKKGVL